MTDATPEALLQLLRQIDAIQFEEQREIGALAFEDRVARGYALSGLHAQEPGQEPGTFVFACDDQSSRFRPGDHVILEDGDRRVDSTIVSLNDAQLVVNHPGPFDETVEWRAELRAGVFSKVAHDALSTLVDARRGTGPAFLKALNGQRSLAGPTLADVPDVVATLQTETSRTLNEDQFAAFAAASAQSGVWGMQGPPGTGKSLVAAFVAESLCRANQRVLVVAHSHEAVNNLLGEIKKLFPSRTVIKTGPVARDIVPSGVVFATHHELDDVVRRTRHRPVVGMTVHAALLRARTRDLRSEVLIVDEASQVPLPFGAALGLLAGSILLFGDPAQLNAIYPEALRSHPLACSVLERFAAHSGDQFAFLSETHRLNSTLAATIGDTYYAGRGFRAAVGNAASRLAIPEVVDDEWAQRVLDPDHPLVWVQTTEVGGYQSSPSEAALIARVIAALLNAGVSPERLAVVTPFRRQVRELRAAVSRAAPSRQSPIIDTVERLQGQSVDLALISLASSDPDYLASVADFYFSDNRWNVALSRARTKVIVVGSPLVLRTLPWSLAAAGAVTKLARVLGASRSVEAPR